VKDPVGLLGPPPGKEGVFEEVLEAHLPLEVEEEGKAKKLGERGEPGGGGALQGLQEGEDPLPEGLFAFL
jgi:hypothetical protein